jgi:hypothetical protein
VEAFEDLRAAVVRDDVDANIARRVTGTLRVPLFLADAQPGAALTRDAQGRVRRNGRGWVLRGDPPG